MNIKEIKDEFISLLKSTAREGIDYVIGIRHLLQKSFHRESGAFLPFAGFVFAVIHNVRKHNRLVDKHRCNPDGRDNIRDIQQEHLVENRSADNHCRIADNDHNQAELINCAAREIGRASCRERVF